MDIIEIIIRMLIKAFDPPKSRSPQSSSNPDEVVRQIQARIEAARLQQPRPAVTRPQGRKTGLNKGQIPAAARKGPPAFKQQKAKRKAPPALPVKAIPAPVMRAVAAPATVPKPAKPTVYVDAQVLGRWLKPQTLRSQFMLTEVFLPPVALRETHLF
jgi:hypothetical protein